MKDYNPESAEMIDRLIMQMHNQIIDLKSIAKDLPNVEPWVLTKLAQAANNIETVRNYLEYEVDSNLCINEGKSAPNNPQLWGRAKAKAKEIFKVYPSAYANAWAAKWYKKAGGTWKTNEGEEKITPTRFNMFYNYDNLPVTSDFVKELLEKSQNVFANTSPDSEIVNKANAHFNKENEKVGGDLTIDSLIAIYKMTMEHFMKFFGNEIMKETKELLYDDKLSKEETEQLSLEYDIGENLSKLSFNRDGIFNIFLMLDKHTSYFDNIQSTFLVKFLNKFKTFLDVFVKVLEKKQ